MASHKTLPLLTLSMSLFIGQCAAAGELYKCSINGQTKYQDTPCEAKAKSTTRSVAGMGSTSAASLSMADLYLEMQSAQKRRGDLEQGYGEALGRAAQDLGSAPDPKEAAAKQEKVRAEWLPKLERAAEREDELAQEIRARCPKGANPSSGRYVCVK